MADSPPSPNRLVTILPCTDLDAAQAFFARLGFRLAGGPPDYRMLEDGRGGEIHLRPAEPGWLTAGRNPFGVYLFSEAVDQLAAAVADAIIEPERRATHKPWGMYEFALNGPDDALVRVGWPSALVRAADAFAL